MVYSSEKLVQKLVSQDLYKKPTLYKMIKAYRDAHGYSSLSLIDITKFCAYHEIDAEAIQKALTTNPIKA